MNRDSVSQTGYEFWVDLMNELFEDEWLKAAAEAIDLTSMSAISDLSFAVSLTVLGGPKGDVYSTWQVKNGSVTAFVGTGSDADIDFNIPWVDALQIIDRKTTPAVAYMQGKLKGSGDMTLLLELLRTGLTV